MPSQPPAIKKKTKQSLSTATFTAPHQRSRRGFELDSDRQLWEQQINEAAVNYRRFLVYAASPPGKRSVDAGRKRYSAMYCSGENPPHDRLTLSQWQHLAKSCMWHLRAKAFDDHRAKDQLEQMAELTDEFSVDSLRAIVALSKRTKNMAVTGNIDVLLTLMTDGNPAKFILESHKTLFGEKHRITADPILETVTFNTKGEKMADAREVHDES